MPADNDALRYVREAALNNIAFAALQVRDIERGIEVVEEAISAAKEPTTSIAALTRVKLENTYMRLLIENRQYAKAGARARLAQTWRRNFLLRWR